MPFYIGENKIVDRYVGDKLVIAAYKGESKYFDAYSEITGIFPIIFKSRAAVALKNYLLHGTSEGAGVKTENLWNLPQNQSATTFNDVVWSINNYAIQGAGTTSSPQGTDAILVRPGGQISRAANYATLYEIKAADGLQLPTGTYHAHGTASNEANVYLIVGVVGSREYASGAARRITLNSDFVVNEDEYVVLLFSTSKAVATYGLSDFMITKVGSAPTAYIPFGYKIPLTNTGENSQSSTYPLYIGSTKLGAEEYVDFGEQKMYKLKDVHTDTVTINGIEWDILGYDHDEVYDSNGNRAQHTVTIQTHKTIYDRQFDAPEAWYYAENGLTAGTYYFTIDPTYDATHNTYKDTGYQFTLTQDVPAGGVLTFPWGYNAQASEVKVSAYASRSATTATESVSVSSGTTGTNLGQLTTAGDPENNLNSIQRVRFGSNNWKQSAMRQYLNSDKAAGNFWTPQTKFDRPPSWNTSADGFLRGVDPDFVSVLGNVQKVTAKNTVTDGGGTETTSEKVFLLSMTEAYCGGSEGAAYSFFKNYSDLSAAGGRADTNRIKYRNNVAKYWWLRSPYPSNAYSTRSIYTSGALDYYSSASAYGVVPACCIILDDIQNNSWLKSHFLKPVDPPVPFPAISTYKGENTLSSTETVGEATIKGRINELPTQQPDN